jgi:hypothetical protein
VSAIIYLEGGGDSKELHSRCREGFRKLLERCAFQERMPRLIACGGRGNVFDDFTSAHNGRIADFIAMWIDSEDLPSDLEGTWAHLQTRDQWAQPGGAVNEQVLFMTTCMETWLVSDRATLREHFGGKLQDSGLPPLYALESRDRQDVQNKLAHATRDCSNAYTKGKRSFEVLGKLTPATLKQHLPSFVRICRILNEKLGRPPLA